MAPQDAQLKNLCHTEETLLRAQHIFRNAKQKTGPQSGHQLGAHITGLPAICAYLASTQLNNTEITRTNAQIASCLKESDFSKVLETVKAALAEADVDSPRKTRSGRDIYEALVNRYPSSFSQHQFTDWANQVRRALIQSDAGFGANTREPPELKYAIFFWIFSTTTGKNPAKQQDYVAEHVLSPKSFSALVKKINECSASLKTRLQNDASRSPTKTNAISTPRRTPKRPPRVLPSRDSPTKRKVVEEPPIPDSEDEENPFVSHETPSKKRKAEIPAKTVISPPTKPKPAEQSPKKLVFPPVASSSRDTLDAQPPQTPRKIQPHVEVHDEPMDVDKEAQALARPIRETIEDEIDNMEPRVRRRFRSVYVDHQQWDAVDHRIKRMRKKVEQYKLEMVELHGHLLQLEV